MALNRPDMSSYPLPSSYHLDAQFLEPQPQLHQPSSSSGPLLFQPPSWPVESPSFERTPAIIHPPRLVQTTRIPSQPINRPTNRPSFPSPITFLPLGREQVRRAAVNSYGHIVPLSSNIPEGSIRPVVPSWTTNSHLGYAGQTGYGSDLQGPADETKARWELAQGLGQAWVTKEPHREASEGQPIQPIPLGRDRRVTSQSEEIRKQRVESRSWQPYQVGRQYLHTAPLPAARQPRRCQPQPIRNVRSTASSSFARPSIMTEPIPKAEQPVAGRQPQALAKATTMPEINFDMDTDLDWNFDLGDLAGIDDLLNRTIVPMNAIMHGNPNPLPAPIGAEVQRRPSGSTLSEALARPRPQSGPILVGNLTPFPVSKPRHRASLRQRARNSSPSSDSLVRPS